MNWQTAEFESAYGLASQLPASDLPEVCFSGRSNVGKSSLINKVLGRKSIARVSSTPGKTVTVNFYKLDTLRLVDLPGYGYAKITDAEKLRFAELLEHYFGSNRNVKLCVQLIDMRHAPQKQDIEMLEFLRYYGIPYVIVLTKCDKLNRSDTEKAFNTAKSVLGVLAEGIEIIPFSSLNGTGVERVREIIADIK